MQFKNAQDVTDYIDSIKGDFPKMEKAQQLEIVDELLIACGRFEIDNNVIEVLTIGGKDMQISDIDKEEIRSMIDSSFTKQSEVLEAKNKAEAVIVEKDAEIKRLTDENQSLASTIDSLRNTITEQENTIKTLSDEKGALATELGNINAEKQYTERIEKLIQANIDVEALTDERKQFIRDCDETVFAGFLAVFASTKKEEPKPEPEPENKLADASVNNDVIVDDSKRKDEIPQIDVTFIRKAMSTKKW